MKRYVVPNLSKACQLLQLLSSRPDGVSTVEIEHILTIPKTTVFRILRTFCDCLMARKHGSLYFAGTGLLQIGLQALDSTPLRDIAVPVLSELASETSQTAHLAIPSGFQSLILEVCDSPHPVRVASHAGTLVPLHCSSTGKVFLAYCFADRLDDIFAEKPFTKHTENTIICRKAMKQEIDAVQLQGYALDNLEYHSDVRCLAVPVWDRHGQVIAAIGVTAAASSFTKKKIPIITKAVKKAARQLTEKIGGRRPDIE